MTFNQVEFLESQLESLPGLVTGMQQLEEKLSQVGKSGGNLPPIPRMPNQSSNAVESKFALLEEEFSKLQSHGSGARPELL